MRFPVSTPVMAIETSATIRHGVRLFVKREDLNHPFISGNKYWKLLYNISEAEQTPAKRILTFGGAFSNHIYAVSAAARETGLDAIGIIRGEKTLPINHTLEFAVENGMELHWVNRETYRQKNDPEFIQTLHDRFGDFYLIPEGGTNTLAIRGCADYAEMELSEFDFDHLFIATGTGGTMAGLICGFKGTKAISGVAVLKGASFLRDDIARMVKDFSKTDYGNWEVLTSYHHGGYARVSQELERFIVTMGTEHNLPLDHVYTGKMMWAVLREIESGRFSSGTRILAIHTGGLQGSLFTGA